MSISAGCKIAFHYHAVKRFCRREHKMVTTATFLRLLAKKHDLSGSALRDEHLFIVFYMC